MSRSVPRRSPVPARQPAPRTADGVALFDTPIGDCLERRPPGQRAAPRGAPERDPRPLLRACPGGRPRLHVWTSDKAAWFAINDDLPPIPAVPPRAKG